MFHVTVERMICTAHRGDRALHGHNWLVRATFSAESLSTTGHVLEPRAAEALLWGLIEPVDHRSLEDLSAFQSQPATAPALARWVADQLQEPRDGGRVRLTRVDVADGTAVISSWTPDR